MITAPGNRGLTRAGVGVAALAALALTACGSGDDEEAGFEEAGAVSEEGEENGASETEQNDTEPELPQAESGFTYQDLSLDVSVTDTLRPERDTVITPTGTFIIDELQTVESVPAQMVNLDPVYEDTEDEGATGDPLDYVPADGEVFRVVNFTFTPHEDLDHSTSTELALHDGAAQSHLHELESGQSGRMLVSMPEDGSTRFVVSSDGHDQFIDLLTGERNDEDEVAAGYYREVTRQDLNHTFATDTDAVEVVHSGGRDVDDIQVDYHVHASSVHLTAWTEDGGWANPGEVWLVADWEYGVDRDGSGRSTVEEVNLTLAVHAGGEVVEEEHYEDSTRGFQDEVTMYAAVPIDTTEVELSTSGSGAVDLGSFVNRAHSIAGSNVREFATEPLEVTFPDERYGSDTDDVEETQEDSDEDVAESEEEADEDES